MSSRAIRKALKQRELQEAQAKLTSLSVKPATTTITSNIGRTGKEEETKKQEEGEGEGEGEGGGEGEGREDGREVGEMGEVGEVGEEKGEEKGGGEEGEVGQVEGEEEEEGESDEAQFSRPKARPNLFAILGVNDEDNVEQEEEEEDKDEDELLKPTNTMPKPPKSNKKKKNKKNKKKDSSFSSARPPPRAEDEIDKALRLLKLNSSPVTIAPNTSLFDSLDQDFLTLLKFDPRNFDASQEMRRLFGRMAVNNNAVDDDGGRGPATRRGRRGVGAGVQGRGTLKRNIFAQPKLNWPNVGSNGLAMVTVKDEVSGDECEFKFVHGARYQDTQRQFMMCVLAMGTLAPIPWLW